MFSPAIDASAIIGGLFGDGLNDSLLGVVVTLVGALVFLTQRQHRMQTKLVAYLCKAIDHFGDFERSELAHHAEMQQQQALMSASIQRLIDAQTVMTASLGALVDRLTAIEERFVREP